MVEENPALAEVLSNAKEKVKSKEELAQVEEIVLREYLLVCQARLNELELKQRNETLTAVEYDRIEYLKTEIEQCGGSDA